MSYENIIQKYSECQGGFLNFQDPRQVISSHGLFFYAFMQEMNQTFSLSYDTEEVYGRNDAIMSYRNTKRNISLSFMVPASSLYQAKFNRLNTRLLIKMLYPRYENKKIVYENGVRATPKGVIDNLQKEYQRAVAIGTSGDFKSLYYSLKERSRTFSLLRENEYLNHEGQLFEARPAGYNHTQTMIENPMIKIYYSNLISTADGGALLGYLDNLNVKPLLDEGFFTECAGEEINPITRKKEAVMAASYPKVYQISCNFNVIHQDPLGWDGTSSPLSDIFNY